jgi:hypothetical protein
MPRWRWKNGRVSRRQAEAVAHVLGAAPALRLLAVHHPPFDRGPSRIVGRGRLLRALADARVDLVLAGHTHVPFTRRVELPGSAHRPIEVIAGTATSRRTRGVGRSWTVLRVDEDTITVEERHQAGTRWRTDRSTSYPRRGSHGTGGAGTMAG